MSTPDLTAEQGNRIKMKRVQEYKTAELLLEDLKQKNITYCKLKAVLFGDKAIKFIKTIRKHGQEAFSELCKVHVLTYQTNIAIQEVTKAD